MSAASRSSRGTFRTLFFLRFSVIGATFGLVALYIEEKWGDKSLVGLHMAVIAGVLILSQRRWGYMADMVWSRKTILLINLPMAAVFLAVAGVVDSFTLFLLAWAFIALFMTPVNPMLNAIVMNSEEARGRYSEIRAWGTVGFIASIGVVSLFADLRGTSWVTFPAAVICVTLTWAWVWRLDAPRLSQGRRVGFADIKRFFSSQPHFRWFFLAIFLNRAAHGPMVVYQIFLAKELAPEGWEARAATSLLMIGAIAEVAVMFMGDRLLRRFGELSLLMWCLGLAVIRFSLVPILGLEGLMAIQVFHAFTFGVHYIAAVSWMNRHTPAEFQTSAQSIFNMFHFGVAPMVGMPIFGWLFQHYSATHLPYLFLGGSGLILVSMMVLAGAMRSEPEGPPPAPFPLPAEVPTNQ